MEWAKPIPELFELGLLPLVRQLNILDDRPGSFTLELFRLCNPSYFSAFKNLRELRIDGLQVSHFMPNIQRHFEYFAPTVESLALVWPVASCRQILYLIGLFKNLQDFTLCNFYPTEENEVTTNLALVPPCHPPPLRGWLTLKHFFPKAEKLLDGMVALYGKFRFRYVILWWVECMQRVVDACADTLETLELEDSPHGEEIFPWKSKEGEAETGRFTDTETFARLQSNLAVSRCKSLRTLRISLKPVLLSPFHGTSAPDFLKPILFTVEPPLPLDVVMVFHDDFFSFGCDSQWSRVHVERLKSGEKCDECDDKYLDRFKALGKVHKERKFRLVLCAEVLGSIVEGATRVLQRNLDAHRDGELGYLLSESSVISTIPHL